MQTAGFLISSARNPRLVNVLNEIFRKDQKDTMIIIIKVGGQEEALSRDFIQRVEESGSSLNHFLNKHLVSRFNRNCGFNIVEILEWQDKNFWPKFLYLMPSYKDSITKTVVTKKVEKVKKAEKTETAVRAEKKIRHDEKQRKTPTPPPPPLPLTESVQLKPSAQQPATVAVKTENEIVKEAKPGQARRLSRSNSNRIHPRSRSTLDEVNENIDFWQKIAAINPTSQFEYEPIGVAMIRGNRESLNKRFGGVGDSQCSVPRLDWDSRAENRSIYLI
jgi:hypothetical protein